ncbi:MAG: N-acetylglucosamine-6-phosphate deacetylase [Thermoleophilia bacterium]|nr:N-acetylglucosamine-6-phosphate deacetylase [Thermoleophilia bacterium]
MRLGVEAALIDGRLIRGDLEIAEGCVQGHGLSSPNGRGIAVPGFVDLQVNGFAGVDFLKADEDGYRRAGEGLLQTGVTSYLPTLITAPEKELVAALRGMPRATAGARILGAHLEGPFLSPARLGAHPAAARRDPDLGLLDRLLGAGPIRLLTLAPELPGAHHLIRTLLARGVTVSFGHSDATAGEANAGFDLGVHTVTHLFNAMRPFHHRDPGIAGVALAREDVVVQVILDGIHLASETAALVWRAARGRVALVTDFTVAPGGRTPDGVLAGGTAPMIEAVRSLHALGASFEDAVLAATEIPAHVIAHPTAGRLGLGLPADVVVLTDGLEIERVLLAGEDRLS